MGLPLSPVEKMLTKFVSFLILMEVTEAKVEVKGYYQCTQQPGAIMCYGEDLPTVARGFLNCSGYSVGDKCTLTCDDAFFALSSTETICQQNDQYTGIWSGGNIECAAVVCSKDDLPKVTGGAFNCSGYLIGDTCNLTCGDAFYVSSSYKTICQQTDLYTGIWSDGNFECTAVICSEEDLPNVASGSFNCSRYSIGDSCNLTCDDGFYILASNKTICLQNDQSTAIWSNENFECAEYLPNVTHGSLHCSGYSVGDKCSPTCDDGFFISSSNETVCIENYYSIGICFHGIFECSEIRCSAGILPRVTNGMFTCPSHSDILEGDICVLTCQDPFYPSQSKQAVCGAGKGGTGGEWTRANFSCRTIDCNEWNLWSGNSYKWIEEHLSWDDARSFCQAIGAHLVNIVDQEENNFVHMILSQCMRWNAQYSWIGLGDLEKNDKWEWSNGEISSYRNWDQTNSQPDNRETENYGGMEKELGKWHDFYIVVNLPAVCERNK